MDLRKGGDGPKARRRKAITERETLQKLVSRAVSEIVSDLTQPIFGRPAQIQKWVRMHKISVAHPDILFSFVLDISRVP